MIAALRIVHFASVVLLAGGLAFFLCIARPALRERAQAASVWHNLREAPLRVAAWSLALAFASGVLWLLFQTAEMSGVAVANALDRETLATVVSVTLFGHVWIARLALAAALGGTLFFLRRASGQRETAALAVCTVLAAALLATLAWTGHATGEQGSDRIVHLCADVVHLFAAGAWIGALPALVFVLARVQSDIGPDGIAFAAHATRRFSILGIASVVALILTGAVNAWYTVGSVPGLFGTGYGRLLCAKLALFAAMVALAAINRTRFTPRLSPASPETARAALASLRRNAIAETVLGLAVLGVVGVLGITIPAPHVQPVWPFSRTLDWDAVVDARRMLVAVLVVVFAAGAAVVVGMRVRRREIIAAGIAAAVGAAIASAWMFSVPANPTTYFQSPVSYDAASIARGAPLYAEHCAACHGRFGEGDGPAAKSLPRRPPNLTTSVRSRREGDMLWWVEHGIANTGMPGIGERVSQERLWDILNYLRALADADAGRRLNAFVNPGRAVTAPDFTFQIGRGAQESLAQLRGRTIVLLVFYSLPRSLPRLQVLARSKLRLYFFGVRVIAVPIKDTDAVIQDASGVDDSMLAEPDATLVDTYALFARTLVDQPAMPTHLEFVIDRRGYIRTRWPPGKDPGWSEMSDLLRQAVDLNSERPRAPAAGRHAH